MFLVLVLIFYVNMVTCWYLWVIAILTDWFCLAHAHDCSSSESILCREELDNLLSHGHNFMNDELLDEMCSKQHKALQCVKTYAESCLQEEEQKIFQMLTEGSDQFFYDFCSEESVMRKEYQKHSACIKSLSSQLDECTEEYKFSQKFLDEHEADTKLLKKNTCCIYFENIRCSSNATLENCGEEAAEVVTKLYTLLGGTYLNKVCESFDSEKTNSCTIVSRGTRSANKTNTPYLLFLLLYGTMSYL